MHPNSTAPTNFWSLAHIILQYERAWKTSWYLKSAVVWYTSQYCSPFLGAGPSYVLSSYYNLSIWRNFSISDIAMQGSVLLSVSKYTQFFVPTPHPSLFPAETDLLTLTRNKSRYSPTKRLSIAVNTTHLIVVNIQHVTLLVFSPLYFYVFSYLTLFIGSDLRHKHFRF